MVIYFTSLTVSSSSSDFSRYYGKFVAEQLNDTHSLINKHCANCDLENMLRHKILVSNELHLLQLMRAIQNLRHENRIWRSCLHKFKAFSHFYVILEESGIIHYDSFRRLVRTEHQFLEIVSGHQRNGNNIRWQTQQKVCAGWYEAGEYINSLRARGNKRKQF